LRPGLCPGPHWGAYSAPPDFLAALGVGRRGRDGEDKKGEEQGRARERRAEKGWRREGNGGGKEWAPTLGSSLRP